MPYTVRKQGTPAKPWAIVNKGNGHIAGHSKTKAKAAQSAAIRNGTHNRGKMGRTK
jgi:hypothetical protein